VVRLGQITRSSSGENTRRPASLYSIPEQPDANAGFSLESEQLSFRRTVANATKYVMGKRPMDDYEEVPDVSSQQDPEAHKSESSSKASCGGSLMEFHRDASCSLIGFTCLACNAFDILKRNKA
jgi:hypothetical protein